MNMIIQFSFLEIWGRLQIGVPAVTMGGGNGMLWWYPWSQKDYNVQKRGGSRWSVTKADCSKKPVISDKRKSPINNFNLLRLNGMTRHLKTSGLAISINCSLSLTLQNLYTCLDDARLENCWMLPGEFDWSDDVIWDNPGSYGWIHHSNCTWTGGLISQYLLNTIQLSLAIFINYPSNICLANIACVSRISNVLSSYPTQFDLSNSSSVDSFVPPLLVPFTNSLMSRSSHAL